jgi:hypothetical protein
MAVDRHQVDLSIKKPIYDAAMKRMKALQKYEREKYGVKRTSLSDIGREAIMRYERGDGVRFEARIVRSPAGQKPKREPFRFDVASGAYERQKRKITAHGYRVTQVVEEALKRFTETGELPWLADEKAATEQA